MNPFFNMPFPNPQPSQTQNQEGDTKPEGEQNQQVPPMGSFQDMFKNMFSMWGINPQFMNPMAGMEQFGGMFKNMFPMQYMNPQSMGQQSMQFPNMMQYMNPYMYMQMYMSQSMAFMQEAMKYLKPVLEKLKDKNSSNLPFGLPVGVLQYFLNMDSSPEGLSKLQKVLDAIFDYYSKPVNQNHFDVPAYEKPEEKKDAEAVKTDESAALTPEDEKKPSKEVVSTAKSDMPEPPEFVKKMIAEGKNPEMPDFVKKMLEAKNK